MRFRGCLDIDVRDNVNWPAKGGDSGLGLETWPGELRKCPGHWDRKRIRVAGLGYGGGGRGRVGAGGHPGERALGKRKKRQERGDTGKGRKRRESF